MTTAPDAETPDDNGSDYVSDREFADFPIAEETLSGLHDMGFSTATPVQAATIDAAIAGKDMIVRAKTGTGKTAAFMVPIIERTPDGHRKPYAIVLEPTRELAQQTAEQASQIARFRDVGVATLVGGVAMGPQEDALRDGTEVLVGTPGRVLDHIRRGNLDPSTIEIVALDEADEMLSMGFYEDVSKIIDRTSDDRQVLLFSATISRDTQRLVKRYLDDDAEEIMLSTDADGVDLIEHILYESKPGLHKARALLYLLDMEDPDSAIIFCNTREDTATVATFLDRQGLDAQLISGELSQARRSKVMKKVKAGEVRFLVATDVAARGIDISDLSHVVNYALPQDPSVYLHRTGRTGRIGKKGRAISLVGATDLSTRHTLIHKHQIDFEERQLPDAETAVKYRVERQAKQIKAAMGSLVFESYLPTVRALLERDDGEILLAAALRAFFTWDRERKAEASDEITTIEAVRNARERKAERRRERDGGRRGGRKGRGSRRDGGRDRDRDRRGKRSRSRSRDDDDGGLDDLLEVADTPKKSKKKKSKGSSAPAAKVDDLLEVEDAPRPKKKSKKKKKSKGSDGGDDLDALLDIG